MRRMPGTKPPPFFCPLCGQKHRADLTPLLKRPGLSLRTRCQGCDAPLSIQMEGGKPVAKATGTPTPPPTPDIGGPYEKDVELAPGDRAGRYEIEALLQRGHTSTIYRAHDPETKRTVALKVLGAQADAEAKARFERQIEVQGRIRHPNVLPVYDRGALADGRPFFAAELLHDPQTLDGLVGRMRSGAIGPDDPLAAMGDVAGLVRDVLLPIADGISVANVENGEIHRDLRPGNVLVDGQSGRPYVTDFSLAAPPSDTQKARPVPLTPYVAPETTQDRVHPRTDVWGLGALLVLVLSGEPRSRAGAGRCSMRLGRDACARSPRAHLPRSRRSRGRRSRPPPTAAT